MTTKWNSSIRLTFRLLIFIGVICFGIERSTAQQSYPLDEATDNGLSWTTSTVRSWVGQTNVSYDGYDAAFTDITNTYPAFTPSSLQTTVTGPARVSFWWMYNGINPYGYGLYLQTDSSIALTASAPGVWTNNYVDIPFGTHTLKWVAYNNGLFGGHMQAALDEVIVTPLIGDPPQVTVSPSAATVEVGQPLAITGTVTGSTPLQYYWSYPGSFYFPVPPGFDGPNHTIDQVTRANAGTYTLTVQNLFGSAQASTVVTASLDGLARGMDTTNLEWTLSGQDDWFNQTNVTHDGVDALRSPTGSYPSGTVSTVVTGPASVKFWMKYSVMGWGYDYCNITLDGSVVEREEASSGGFDWKQIEVLVPAGDHTLSWTYGNGSFTDAVYLDQLTVEQLTGDPPTVVSLSPDTTVAEGDQVTLSVEAGGTQPVAYQWLHDEMPIYGATNSTLQFQGTIPAAGTYSVDLINLFGWIEAGYINLAVKPSPISLRAALDNPDLVWKTNPDYPFFGQSRVSHDHRSAAQGGPNSYLQTTIVGPGLLTFWWKSQNGAYFTDVNTSDPFVYYDGTNDWEQVSLAFTAGPHVVEWFSDGADNAISYIDSVHFTPTSDAPPKITMQPKDQHVDIDGAVTFTVKASVAPPYSYQWSFNGNDIDSATDSALAIPDVTPDAYGYYNVRITDPFGTTTSRWALLSETTIWGTAVGEPGIGWWSDDNGYGTWFVQNRVKHGNSALQSPQTPDTGTSAIYNTITGPGTLSFWWRVSSETNFDELQFIVNDEMQMSISGNTGWRHATYHIAADQETVQWAYVKDDTTASGADCGWISDVTFTPDPTDLVTITPHELTVYDGSVARFQTITRGATPWEYDWLDMWGDVIAGGPELKIAPATSYNAGTYSISVSSDSGSATDSAILHVRPAVEGVRAIAGNDAMLMLHTSGETPTTYNWSIYDWSLADDGHFSGTTNAVLNIKDVTPDDSQTYTVSAVNDKSSYTWQAQANLVVYPSGPIIGWGAEDFTGIDEINSPPDLTDAVAISTGLYNSIALLPDGTVRAWDNSSGGDVFVPDDLMNVTMVAAGGDFAAVLTRDGSVTVWRPGDPYSEQLLFTGARSISASNDRLLVGMRDGTVETLGSDGSELDVPSDVKNIVAVAAGNGFSLALTKSGTVTGWDNNDFGQLMPPHLSDAVAIAAGDINALALRRNCTVVAWGDNSSGQTTVPSDLHNVVAIAAGSVHSVALTSDGRVVCWGATNMYNASSGIAAISVPVGLRNVARISAAGTHTMALIYAPSIIQGPDVGFNDDTTSMISIEAGGRGPLFYDWRYNGHFLKTTAVPYLIVHTPSSPQQAQHAAYAVMVRNRYGSVLSKSVNLGELFGESVLNGVGSTTLNSDSIGLVKVGNRATNISSILTVPEILATGQLSIIKQGDSIVLSWPASSQLVLEAADSVVGPFSNDSLASPVSAGATNSLAIPISAQQKFYRLRANSN